MGTQTSRRSASTATASEDSEAIQQILHFYRKPLRENKHIFSLWASADDVGAAIVPSVYDPNYRSTLIALIDKLLNCRNDAALLSIGSGVGATEQELQARGYSRLLCSDLMPEAVEIMRQKGLNTVLASGLDLPVELRNQSFDLVLMDGCLGHMASSFVKPFFKPFAVALTQAAQTLKPGGYLVISDDPPSDDQSFEINPRVPLLRANEKIMRQELRQNKFTVMSIIKVPYFRPNIGNIFRRVIVARKISAQR